MPAAVLPYTLAARLADLLLGVKIGPMGIWKVSQRLGQAVATVLLSVDGCTLCMHVRSHRRRQTGTEPLPPLPPVDEGHFREVKTGVLLLPQERVETSPGRHPVVRRFLVSCPRDADDIFHRTDICASWAGSVPARR